MTGGVRGAFTLTLQNPGASQRTLAILGDDGRLEGDFEAGRFEVRTHDGAPPLVWSSRAAADGHGGGDARAIESFLNACAGRGEPDRGDKADTLRGLVFALAAERSREMGAVARVKSDLSGFE